MTHPQTLLEDTKCAKEEKQVVSTHNIKPLLFLSLDPPILPLKPLLSRYKN